MVGNCATTRCRVLGKPSWGEAGISRGMVGLGNPPWRGVCKAGRWSGRGRVEGVLEGSKRPQAG